MGEWKGVQMVSKYRLRLREIVLYRELFGLCPEYVHYRPSSSVSSFRCPALPRIWSRSFDYLQMRQQRQSKLRSRSKTQRSGAAKPRSPGKNSTNLTKPRTPTCQA